MLRLAVAVVAVMVVATGDGYAGTDGQTCRVIGTGSTTIEGEGEYTYPIEECQCILGWTETADGGCEQTGGFPGNGGGGGNNGGGGKGDGNGGGGGGGSGNKCKPPPPGTCEAKEQSCKATAESNFDDCSGKADSTAVERCMNGDWPPLHVDKPADEACGDMTVCLQGGPCVSKPFCVKIPDSKCIAGWQHGFGTTHVTGGNYNFELIVAGWGQDHSEEKNYPAYPGLQDRCDLTRDNAWQACVSDSQTCANPCGGK